MSDDGKEDEIDGSGFAGEDSNVLDGSPIEPENSGHRLAYTTIIIVIIAVLIAVGVKSYEMYFYEEDVKTQEEIRIITDEKKCQNYLIEASVLIDRNGGSALVENWNNTDDRLRLLEINETYKQECIPDKEEVMDKLQACTILLITIESLINQMEAEDGGFNLDSLPEEKQKQYNDSYRTYFDMYCNKIIEEIKQTNAYQNFNVTRNE